MARDYRKIRAWQLADELALALYRATRGFPKSEVFGLTSQTRRAAVSVPANIIEGSARKYHKEYVQFLHIALGSLAEVGYYIGFAHRIGYLEDAEHSRLAELHETASKTLRALVNYIEKSGKSRVQGPRSSV